MKVRLIGFVLGCFALFAQTARAQGVPPPPQPPALCPDAWCTYYERNGDSGMAADLGRFRYRVQALQACLSPVAFGCALQYWVSDLDTGRVLLVVPPSHSAVIAIGSSAADPDHPPIRTFLAAPEIGARPVARQAFSTRGTNGIQAPRCCMP